jgi:hypothetical protein
VGRLTSGARAATEQNIRAAMDRLLRGDLPPGGRCDITTLAAHAGVTRIGFYPKDGKPGPWQHLADEFHRRLAALRDAGNIPDPRDAQIARLKADNDALRRRLAEQDTVIAGHTAFRQQAVSRLAAQHEELQRLRDALARPAKPGGRTAALTVLPPRQEEAQP